MSNNLIGKVYLVGTGYMAIEYAKVLDALKIDYEVIGRGKESATKFKMKVGKNPFVGGINEWFEKNRERDYTKSKVIIAVSIEQLAAVTIEFLKRGFKNILVEKPGGLNIAEIRKVSKETCKYKANVFIAYNRRFYSSVMKAREIIEKDGGVKSFNFEFTEWSHEIEKLDKDISVKWNWFLANSSHVVDLAFYLGGRPKKISCYVSGGLWWHPSASIFYGAGEAENGALFSYQANWEAPGRWGIEILTNKHRIILRPLEKLQIQNIGSTQTYFIDNIDDKKDIQFKPGLYLQTINFLEGNYSSLCSVFEQVKNCKIYSKISKGK